MEATLTFLGSGISSLAASFSASSFTTSPSAAAGAALSVLAESLSSCGTVCGQHRDLYCLVKTHREQDIPCHFYLSLPKACDRRPRTWDLLSWEARRRLQGLPTAPFPPPLQTGGPRCEGHDPSLPPSLLRLKHTRGCKVHDDIRNGLFFRCQPVIKASPASRTLMMAGVCSMSRETLSNQLFSIRNMKTFRRLCRPLWASALSRLASSGWYLDLNLCPESGSTKKLGGDDGGWDEGEKVRTKMHIIYLYYNCVITLVTWSRNMIDMHLQIHCLPYVQQKIHS